MGEAKGMELALVALRRTPIELRGTPLELRHTLSEQPARVEGESAGV